MNVHTFFKYVVMIQNFKENQLKDQNTIKKQDETEG